MTCNKVSGEQTLKLIDKNIFIFGTVLTTQSSCNMSTSIPHQTFNM